MAENGRTLFAQRLTAARQARGLSQTEVASLAGVSRSLVAKLETGESDPFVGRFDCIARLSKVLKLSLDEAVKDIESTRSRKYRARKYRARK